MASAPRVNSYPRSRREASLDSAIRSDRSCTFNDRRARDSARSHQYLDFRPDSLGLALALGLARPFVFRSDHDFALVDERQPLLSHSARSKASRKQPYDEMRFCPPSNGRGTIPKGIDETSFWSRTQRPYDENRRLRNSRCSLDCRSHEIHKGLIQNRNFYLRGIFRTF